MRKSLARLIKKETKNARDGKPAYVHAKLNGLVDVKLIHRLYEASQAGVEVKLVVRGVCSLVPGVPGLSENIRVISIVDRYLEHSRIAFFCNGGKERCYLFSADWMPRNFDHRVEVGVPVYDPALREELRRYLEFQFNDAQKARLISETQDNRYASASREGKGRAQFDIYDELEKRYREAKSETHDVSSN
jgi:polyphosphate kinase